MIIPAGKKTIQRQFAAEQGIVISKKKKKNGEQVGVVFDRIIGSSDPELFVDRVGNLSTSRETVLFLGPLFLQTDFPSEMGIMDDLVQGWSNPCIKYFKIRHWNTTSRWRRS